MTGICTTTNSGLANALNWIDLNFGVESIVGVLSTTFAVIYLATLVSCCSSPPIPDNWFNSNAQSLSSGSLIASNLLDKYTSTLSEPDKFSVSISTPTNCLDSAVKKSAGDVIT